LAISHYSTKPKRTIRLLLSRDLGDSHLGAAKASAEIAAKASAEMAASQRSSGGAKGAICFFSTLVAFSDEAVSLTFV